jgi:hypothetical protein
MATAYIGTNPSQPIAQYPHATYRVVIGRKAFYALDYITRFVTWPGVVLSVVENSVTEAGFPLGTPEKSVSGDDDRAVIDYLAGSHPGSRTVSDLVRAVDSSSKYIEVLSVERRGAVTKESAGGAVAFDADRDAETDRQRIAAEEDSFLSRLRSGLLKGGIVVGVIAVAGIALGLIYVLKAPGAVPSSSSKGE